MWMEPMGRSGRRNKLHKNIKSVHSTLETVWSGRFFAAREISMGLFSGKGRNMYVRGKPDGPERATNAARTGKGEGPIGVQIKQGKGAMP